MARPIFIPSALSLALLAGCAAGGEYPSLAPRDVEKLSMDEPVRVAPVQDDDPALGTRLAELLSQARAGNAAFQARLPSASTLAEKAGAAGSETWIEAQQELSRLEASRAPTVTALGDLDALSLARAGAGTSAADAASVTSALDEVRGLAEAQQAASGRLTRLLTP